MSVVVSSVATCLLSLAMICAYVTAGRVFLHDMSSQSYKGGRLSGNQALSIKVSVLFLYG